MLNLFISGWKREPGPGGLTHCLVDEKTGVITEKATYYEDVSFNSMYMDAENRTLYALNETADNPNYPFGGGGSVYKFVFDDKCDVSERRIFPTLCTMPCSLAFSANKKYAVIAGHGSKNYVTKIEENEGGSYSANVKCDDTPVILFDVLPSGDIGRTLDVKFHHGSGIGPKQRTAHPHSTSFSPSGNFIVVCDKGADKIYIYSIDETENKLSLLGNPFELAKGTQPRCCVFNPVFPVFYVNTEGSSDIYVFDYDEQGNISLKEVVGSLGFENEKTRNTEQQGLIVHPSGKYLYDVVHNPNLVSVFRIDDGDGSLELIQNRLIEYDWPRGSAVLPSGNMIAVSCVRGCKTVIYGLGEDGLIGQEVSTVEKVNSAFPTLWKNE